MSEVDAYPGRVVDSDGRFEDQAATPEPGGRRHLERTVVLVIILALALIGGLGWLAISFGVNSATSSAPVPEGPPALGAAASGSPSPTLGPTPSGTPTPRPSKATVRIPKNGSGRYTLATVSDKPAGTKGKVITFDVRVEQGLPYSANDVAHTMATTLNDKRSWRGGGTVRFRLVPRGTHADLHAYLATPGTVDKLCAPLGTHGDLSCRNGATIALNAERWAFAEPWFHGDVVAYREYLVNHEFGHAIGHQHERCPGKGKLAPVMMQQTKGLHGCLPNPWPYPHR